MKALVKRFLRDEQGLELSEYAIMAALVIIVAIAVILAVGGNINDIFGLLNTQLASAQSAS